MDAPIQVHEEDRATLLDTLGLHPPVPVVVIIGGAGKLDEGPKDLVNLIETVFEEALRPAIAQIGAVVLTGGTDAGVMRIAGSVLADISPALIGVVPEAVVSGPAALAKLELRHAAVVLTSGQRFGSETDVLFDLAEQCTAGTAPGLVVLANGGPVSFEEARRFLRGGWPIVTVSGSRGAAQDLSEAVARSELRSEWGDLRQADVERLEPDPTMARSQVLWRLHTDQLLKLAWASFASYDRRANALRESARRAQILLAILSSLLLVAVTVTVQFAALGWTTNSGGFSAQVSAPLWDHTLWLTWELSKWTILALPLGIAVAVALGNFSGSRGKWRVVRSSAETLKREIYRYRARRAVDDPNAASRIAAVLHVVDDEAIRAEIGLAESPPPLVRGRPPNVDPDELLALNVKIYAKRRLERQLLYYADAARKRRHSEWLVVALGAVAATLAVAVVNTRFAPWVAILVLAATAFAFSRERGLSHQQISGYDRAIADINDVWIAWLQKSPDDQRTFQSLVELVDEVESAFERETLSWSEVMRRAAQQATAPHVGLDLS